MNQAQQMAESLGSPVVEAAEEKQAKAVQKSLVKYFNAVQKTHPGNIANDLVDAIEGAVKASGIDDKTKKVVLGNIQNQTTRASFG